MNLGQVSCWEYDVVDCCQVWSHWLIQSRIPTWPHHRLTCSLSVIQWRPGQWCQVIILIAEQINESFLPSLWYRWLIPRQACSSHHQIVICQTQPEYLQILRRQSNNMIWMKISKWDLLMRDNVLNGAVWDDMGFLLTLIWEVFLGSNRMSNYHTTNTIESTVLLCISADVECTLGGAQGSRSYATYPHALSPHWPFVRIKETNDNNVIFVSSNFWGDFL